MNSDRKRIDSDKLSPWNRVQVTFDIPKEAVERLRFLDHGHLMELGILTIELMGQPETIIVKQTKPQDTPSDSPEAKRMKLDSSSVSSSTLSNPRMNGNEMFTSYPTDPSTSHPTLKIKVNGLHSTQYYPSDSKHFLIRRYDPNPTAYTNTT